MNWGGEWPALALGAFGLLSVALIYVRYSHQLEAPALFETATVLRFGQYSSEKGDFPTIIIRRADGRIQQLRAPRRILADCRRGGQVRLVQHGTMVRVNIPACPNAPLTGQSLIRDSRSD